jgi:hypothetical protein
MQQRLQISQYEGRNGNPSKTVLSWVTYLGSLIEHRNQLLRGVVIENGLGNLIQESKVA